MTLPRSSFLLALPVLLTATWLLQAQSPDTLSSGDRLQQLIAGEQAALDANDSPHILASGRKLGSFSLQLLGSLYRDQGKCLLAAEAYRQSLASDDSTEDLPQHVQTAMLVLSAELCARRPEAVDMAAEQILRLAGDTAQIHLLIANTRHAADDLPGTIAEIARAVALDPRYGPAHLALADAFWELNEYQYNPDTLREFTAAQTLAPADFYTNQGLGSVLSQYERYGEAEPFLRNAIAADPSSPDPWLQLGMNAFAQTHLDEALVALKTAVTLTGPDEDRNGYQIRRAYAALACIDRELGRSLEAEENARHEADLHTRMLNANIVLPLTESTGVVVAHTLKASVQPAAAQNPTQQREIEQRLKTIAAKSLNDAGTVLARDRNYEAALPLFRLAANADPDLEPVMRNLGLAAFHTGAYDTAIPALSHALDRHPEDALVRADLEKSRALLALPVNAPRP